MLQQSDIEAAKARVKALMERMERRTLEDALEIGREARRINRVLPHGEVGRWLKDTFGERRARTIYNWMGMVGYAEAHPEEFETFSILNVSAVYLLTAPKTPREAVERIVRQIDAGSIPSVRTVRAEISRAKNLPAVTRRTVEEARGLQTAPHEAAQPDERATAEENERPANGLAALQAVARLIPAGDRPRAVALLWEAAETHYGLRDLMGVLFDASGQSGDEPSDVGLSA